MRRFRYNYIYPLLLVFLSWVFLLNSCKKEEEEDEEPPEHVIENRQFYNLMQDWYYWYDQMAVINPDSYSSVYNVMEALRKRPEDRWSYVTTRSEFESYYIQSKFIGYGFGSRFDDDNKLRVTFVFSAVELYDKGVRRSWIIEEINGTPVQPGVNINQLLGPNEVGVSNKFVFREPDSTLTEITVQKAEVIMNTVLHKEIIEVGALKAGYMVFNGFTSPSFDELAEAIDFFNTEGIDELILDLRYNGGGQTNVANFLGSVIGGPAVAGEPFAKYLYNDKQADSMNFVDSFRAQDQYLDLDRLVVIATKSTASASEMVINGLRPFMDVIIIGDDTYGKPMGMNAWYYGNLYAFVPITFKIANADDFGDYFEGLPADSYVGDDITRFFGDPEESSLKEALQYIESGSLSGLPRRKSLVVQPYEQMTGLRAEIGAH